METKGKTFIALLVCMMFIPTMLFTSCQNDKDFENTNNESNTIQKLQIIVNHDLFNESISKLGISRTQNEISDDEIWNIIKTSFQIVKDNKTISVLNYFETHNKNEAESKELVLGKIFLFENYDDAVVNSRANKELSLEEIRNAMIDECEYGYMEPVASACKAAVQLAYYYKKMIE